MDVSLVDDLRERMEVLRHLGIPTLPAVWLRPEPRPYAGVFTSKIGGQIGWPKEVPWPICDGSDILFDPPLNEQNDYYVPVAQFRRDEFPEICFPENSDILQLLWCPRFHEQPDFDYGL